MQEVQDSEDELAGFETPRQLTILYKNADVALLNSFCLISFLVLENSWARILRSV